MASLRTDNLGVWWALISEQQVNVLTQSITRTVDMEHNVCKTTQDVMCRTVVFKGWELFAENNLHGWDKNIA